LRRSITETIFDRLKSFGRKRPKKGTLRERIEKSLEDIPSPEEMEEVEISTD
jgi:hypothetical protein